MGEDILRKKIVVKLKSLEMRREIFDVIDNCGTCEYGADICFKRNDIFGQPRTYGIQLKNNDISASEAEKTLGQLSIAFGHKFSFCANKLHLDYIYVVTSKTISPTAREYFREANVGFRNIFLIDQDILDIFLSSGVSDVTSIVKQTEYE